MHLYEAHLSVADTIAAKRFYLEIVGLTFAYRDAARDIVFLWIGAKDTGMLGLWGPGTQYGPRADYAQSHHLAFAVEFDQLLGAIKRLHTNGIETLGFDGEESQEPTVIGWMPSAQIYFQDLDGHSLEFISILPHEPRPGFVGSYTEWQQSER